MFAAIFLTEVVQKVGMEIMQIVTYVCNAWAFPDIDPIYSSKLFQKRVIFLQEKAKNLLFHVPLLFFCTQLYTNRLPSI